MPASTALQKAEALLPKLSPNEKAKLLQQVVNGSAKNFPGIEKTPGVCGGDACIIRTRIPVWLLVNWRNLGLSDAQLLEEYPSLREQDLNNAWAYYLAFPAEIEQNIKENDEA